MTGKPGRPPGSLNKPKRKLLQILDEKYPGWHPVVQMAGIANDESNDLLTRFNAAKEVAPYVTPKLKQVTLDPEGAQAFTFVMHAPKAVEDD